MTENNQLNTKEYDSTLKDLITGLLKISELSTDKCNKCVDIINSKFKRISYYIDETHPNLENLLQIIKEEFYYEL